MMIGGNVQSEHAQDQKQVKAVQQLARVILFCGCAKLLWY